MIQESIWPKDPHTDAKHDILKRYLEAWFPIMSSQFDKKLIYLDGFAGPGIYKKKNEADPIEYGSPVIAIETAINHSLFKKLKEIDFIFIEKDKARASILENVLEERFPSLPDNMKYYIKNAEFDPTVDFVISKIGSEGAPTFAFIDPFGFAGLPMRQIAKILEIRGCEVLITFMSGFVNRFNDEYREDALTDLFGNEEWKEIGSISDPKERNIFWINLYLNQLKNIGGASFARNFEMKNRSNQTIYHLVFGTNHWRGLEVMKEAMWHVDETGSYLFSDTTNPAQSTILDFTKEKWWISKAANAIYSNYRGKKVPIELIHRYVIEDTPFLFRKSIMKSLESCSPAKIERVDKRDGSKRRAGTFPDGCTIIFKS